MSDQVRQAKVRTIDFTKGPDIRDHASGVKAPGENYKQRLSSEGKSLTAKQIRARARRNNHKISTEELEILYHKPIDEWDIEELAKGRPKVNGKFTGPTPRWINRAMKEEAQSRFTVAVKGEMRNLTVTALETLKDMMVNEDTDDKGKPFVAASTKADISKFFLEHTVGKPTQRVEQDVSVKLQAILGTVMVNPAQVMGDYSMGHMPGITIPMGVAEDDDLQISEG